LVGVSELRKNPAGDAVVLPTASARQAQTGLGVRYVLAISTVAAVSIMGLVYAFFFMT
jgi:hypothetical protein